MKARYLARIVAQLAASLAFLGTPACKQASLRVCAEQLCFELPATIQHQTSTNKHRFALAEQPGWMAVQSFAPDTSIPSTTEERITVIRQRFEDEGWQQITTSAATLAGQSAIRVDATRTQPGTALSRRMWIVPREGSWIALDVTGPQAEFSRVLAAWEPLANRAQREVAAPR